MASLNFLSYERTLRKVYWQQMIDRELDIARKSRFKASLVVNSHTGLLVNQASAPCLALPRTHLTASASI